MNPLSGHSRAAKGGGQVVREPIAPLHITAGTTAVVADRALYRAMNRQQRAHTPLQGLTRVTATVRDAHAVLAQAAPQPLMPLTEGYRERVLPSTGSGIAPRWGLIDSEARQPQAKRPGAKPLLRQRAQEGKAFKHLWALACACDVEARQA
jgi:hypothetical protein